MSGINIKALIQRGLLKMSEINVKALICTAITLILIPFFIYIAFTNAIFLIIIGVILSIITIIVLFYGLYMFFDEWL